MIVNRKQHQLLSNPVSDEVSLQGRAEMYTVRLLSTLRNYSQELEAERSTTTFVDLQPNTQYFTTVTVTINGGAYITSDPVYVTTMDGGKTFIS